MVHSTDAIIHSFAAFAKLCIDKKEVPYFKFNSINLDKFFFNVKGEHPQEFRLVSFNTNGHEPFSDDVSKARMDMLICGYLYSWAFNPYFTSKKILEEFEKIENKEEYVKIAEKFYKEFGCDENCNLNKRNKFRSLEELH